MRRALPGLALVAALCGCEAVLGEIRGDAPAPPPRPRDIPAIGPTFVHELVTRRKVDGVKLRVYSAGTLTARGSAVSSLKSANAKLRLDVPCFVVRHPSRGLLLFDAGLAPGRDGGGRFTGLPEAAPLEPGRDIVSQLRADGVEPAEIKTLVLSDLRFEHAGMIGAFSDADVVVDRRELEHAVANASAKGSRYELATATSALRLRLRPVDLSTAPAYASFDHGQDLFGDGTVFLLDLSGHSPGGLGLWVNLDEGPVLLAGDAAWVLDNYQDLAPPSARLIHDPAAYWRRVYELRDAEAALPRLLIFPGHDLIPLRLKPRGDVTLAEPAK